MRWVDQLLEGMQTMRESTTYRRIINDGRLEEAQRLLLLLGTKRFREPDAATVAALRAIRDIDLLEVIGANPRPRHSRLGRAFANVVILSVHLELLVGLDLRPQSELAKRRIVFLIVNAVVQSKS
jgi:hypothetical protein